MANTHESLWLAKDDRLNISTSNQRKSNIEQEIQTYMVQIMHTAATATHTSAWLPGAGLNDRSREAGGPAHNRRAA